MSATKVSELPTEVVHVLKEVRGVCLCLEECLKGGLLSDKDAIEVLGTMYDEVNTLLDTMGVE